LKSDMFAETEVWAYTMLPGPIACTVPPLNDACAPVLLAVGVNTIVTVAVEPAWSVGRLQLMTVLVVETPLQVPPMMLAVTGVRGTPVALKLSVIVIPLARSGPLLVTV